MTPFKGCIQLHGGSSNHITFFCSQRNGSEPVFGSNESHSTVNSKSSRNELSSLPSENGLPSELSLCLCHESSVK